ncbi:MAG: universal stress protein [Terriglobales bacterium]
MSFQRILIAVDNEPIAAHAAEIGVELACKLGAEIAFIHVVDPKALGAQEPGVCASELVALAQLDARRLVAAFRARLPSESSALEFVQLGRAAAEVVSAAKCWPADLIVIGSHGRGGIERALLGSVAEAVVRRAPCPVLVIKAKC